jgi:hypothetical protein
MAERSIDIDRVVREVLADLGSAPGATASGGTGSSSASAEHAKTGETRADRPPVAPGDLIITSRVVTLSELDGRLEAVRRLVVSPGAVITPAVRDELRRKDVSLAYTSPVAARGAAPVRLVLVAMGKQPDPTPLLGALGSEGIEVDQHGGECLIAATDQLAGEIGKPGTLGVLLTRHTAAGLCLANRQRGVRAISGTNAAAVAAATASVGANLLVLNAAAMGPFLLKQIVTEFCRGGTRPCPEAFRERLA